MSLLSSPPHELMYFISCDVPGCSKQLDLYLYEVLYFCKYCTLIRLALLFTKGRCLQTGSAFVYFKNIYHLEDLDLFQSGMTVGLPVDMYLR
jgi:hypothetical protein